MRKLIRRISETDSILSVANWIWTGVALVIGGIASTISYIENVISPWGTLGWVLATLVVAIFLSIVFAIIAYGVDQLRRGRDRKNIGDIIPDGSADARDLAPGKEPGSQKTTDDKENVGNSDPAVGSGKAEFLPQGLFVGEICIAIEEIKNNVLIISVCCFNATGRTISVVSVRGNVYAWLGQFGVPFGDEIMLSPPRLAYERGGAENIENLASSTVVLEQTINTDIISLIASIDAKSRFWFEFSSLDILVSPTDEYGLTARLPLWKVATMHKSCGEFVTKRALLVTPPGATIST